MPQEGLGRDRCGLTSQNEHFFPTFSLTQQLTKGPSWILQHPDHFSKDTEQRKCHGWLCTVGRSWCTKEIQVGWNAVNTFALLCAHLQDSTKVLFLLLLILVDKNLVLNTWKITSRDGAEATCKDPVQIYSMPKVSIQISLSYFVLQAGVFCSCSVWSCTIVWQARNRGLQPRKS